MSVNVAQNSRLRFAQLGQVDGIEFWDLLDLPDLPPQSDDVSYQVQLGDRIDVLANRFYGDPVLWWVIAQANDLEILPLGLDEGLVLRVPSPRYVLQHLFQAVTG